MYCLEHCIISNISISIASDVAGAELIIAANNPGVFNVAENIATSELIRNIIGNMISWNQCTVPVARIGPDTSRMTDSQHFIHFDTSFLRHNTIETREIDPNKLVVQGELVLEVKHIPNVFHHTDGEALEVAILYADNTLRKLCRIVDRNVFDDILPNVARSPRYLIVVLVESSCLQSFFSYDDYIHHDPLVI